MTLTIDLLTSHEMGNQDLLCTIHLLSLVMIRPVVFVLEWRTRTELLYAVLTPATRSAWVTRCNCVVWCDVVCSSRVLAVYRINHCQSGFRWKSFPSTPSPPLLTARVCQVCACVRECVRVWSFILTRWNAATMKCSDAVSLSLLQLTGQQVFWDLATETVAWCKAR